jgi:hypothetical protein
MAQAPATAGTTTITEARSTVGATTHPPGDHPKYYIRADHHHHHHHHHRADHHGSGHDHAGHPD